MLWTNGFFLSLSKLLFEHDNRVVKNAIYYLILSHVTLSKKAETSVRNREENGVFLGTLLTDNFTHTLHWLYFWTIERKHSLSAITRGLTINFIYFPFWKINHYCNFICAHFDQTGLEEMLYFTANEYKKETHYQPC